MDMTKWIVLGVVALVVVGLTIFYRRRKKSMDQVFEQIFATARQVPKQKKHSFLLFMFKESIKASKSKSKNAQARMNDPKYVEVQLVQMGGILKDRTKVKDKQIKQALRTYDSYLIWEKSKLAKSKGVA
jgi:hypothetical protein